MHSLSSAPPFRRAGLTLALALGLSAAHAAPVGGVVAAGTANIATSGARTTITQSSRNAVINWQGFGIAAGEAVRFRQPDANSVALNRVVGSDPSAIFGNLSANGKVFLVNPNGVLFGSGASVNVGGLVASTLDVGTGDFMAGRYAFAGGSRAAVANHGAIDAAGGYVALVGANVLNQGSIEARGGSVALVGGRAVTLDVLGDNLLHVSVDRGAVNALVRNGGFIQADGGQVLLTTQAAANLLSTAVNNTGVIQARTLSMQGGTIKLMGDMGNGVVTVAGTLDASAPAGGHGGFIETSAARVRVQPGARVTTAAARGRTGEWLIDPQDFTIGGGATDNISGADLSALLVTNSVVITTAPGPDSTTPGTPPVRNLNTAVEANGDIHVNQAVSWTALVNNNTTLTLNATRDVNINRAVTAVNGNFVACCGRDVNVKAAITTTRGSVLLSAGRNFTLDPAGAMTTTDGNMMICAANDIRIGGAMTLTRGTVLDVRSLDLPAGMVLSAGIGGNGPGPQAGTVVFEPLAPRAVVTGPNAEVVINYNPVAYNAPTNFDANFTRTLGAALTPRMLVYADGPAKIVDGTRATVLTGLKGAPAGVQLVAGPGAVANFDTATVGTGKAVTFSGYTLAGADANSFALPVACCGPALARTTGTILAAVQPGTPLPPGGPPTVIPPPVVPGPVVVVPPPVIAPPPGGVAPVGGAPGGVAPGGEAAGGGQVLPQFLPFVVSPVLLRTPTTLLTVAPAPVAPMEMVIVQAPPPAAPVVAPTPAPAAAPAVPAPAPARVPKPFRN